MLRKSGVLAVLPNERFRLAHRALCTSDRIAAHPQFTCCVGGRCQGWVLWFVALIIGDTWKLDPSPYAPPSPYTPLYRIELQPRDDAGLLDLDQVVVRDPPPAVKIPFAVLRMHAAIVQEISNGKDRRI
jgi:hypothetical protein